MNNKLKSLIVNIYAPTNMLTIGAGSTIRLSDYQTIRLSEIY